MTLEKTRLGNLEYNLEDVFVFSEGLIGFADCQKFLVLQHRPGSIFHWLQSIEDPNLAFLVVDPLVYLPNYLTSGSLLELSDLGISEKAQNNIFVIVTIPNARAEETTINLAAPLIINSVTQNGKQVILDDESFSIKHRIHLTSPQNPEQVA